MKFLKQKIALLLALSLIFSGCNFQRDKDLIISPDTQKKPTSSDFVEEQELLKSIPKNGIFIAFQNSDALEKHAEEIINAILKLATDAPSISASQKSIINQNKKLALSYLKDVQYGAFLLQIKGQKLINGDIELLLEDDADPLEIANYFSEEVCLAIANKIDIKEYKDAIEDAKSNMIPLAKYQKVEDVDLFSFGKCTQEDLDFIANKNNLKNNNFVALVDRASFADVFKNLQSKLEEKFDQESKNNSDLEYIKNSYKNIFESLKEINYFKIIENTNKMLNIISIEENKIRSTRITELKNTDYIEILKNNLIGKAMQKPMYFTDDVVFTFKYKTENKILYYQEEIQNLDWSVVVQPLAIFWLNGNAFVLTTVVVGILATGASTVYSSAQQKARDSIRMADLMALKSTVELYYIDTGRYPEQLEDLITDGYINKIPKNPKYYNDYDYEVSADGQEYYFSVKFEASSNSAKMTIDGGKNDDLWEIGNF